jgi:hypothetical protein
VGKVLKEAVQGLLDLVLILLPSLRSLLQTVRMGIQQALATVSRLGAYLLSWLDFRGLVRSKNHKVAVRMARKQNQPPKLRVMLSPEQSLEKALAPCAKRPEKQRKLKQVGDLGLALEKEAAMPAPLPPRQTAGMPAPAPRQAPARPGAGDVPGRMKKLANLLEDIGAVCGPCPPKKQATGKCFVAVVPAWLGNGGRESLGKLGQRGGAIPRVESHSDEERRRGGGPGAAEHAWVHPQRLWFRMDKKGTGACVQGWLLREAEEWARWGVRVGGEVRLELPEQGVNGWGRVEALEDHPAIATGPGRVVTGWFRHELGVVGDLGIEGEAEPLGVTAGHPFWSSDRHGWVPVGELREGERLRAANGSRPRVLSLTPRREPQPVYNIEVEGDHCYRVGQQGLLVHNASAPYTLTQVAKNGPGYEYATAAAKARQKKDSRGRPKKGLLQGESNGGALKFQEPKATAKYFPGQGTEASQIQILFFYGADPMDHPDQKLPRDLAVILGDRSTCTKILEFFTERTPCPACVSALPDLLKNFVSDEKFPLYYVIQHGKPDSDLIDMYKQWGLWS